MVCRLHVIKYLLKYNFPLIHKRLMNLLICHNFVMSNILLLLYIVFCSKKWLGLLYILISWSQRPKTHDSLILQTYWSTSHGLPPTLTVTLVPAFRSVPPMVIMVPPDRGPSLGVKNRTWGSCWCNKHIIESRIK